MRGYERIAFRTVLAAHHSMDGLSGVQSAGALTLSRCARYFVGGLEEYCAYFSRGEVGVSLQHTGNSARHNGRGETCPLYVLVVRRHQFQFGDTTLHTQVAPLSRLEQIKRFL